MEVVSGTTPGSVGETPTAGDQAAEVRRLRRELRREQALRLNAERLGERATADLYDSVRELRSTQAELLERTDRAHVVTELARALRQDVDSAQLVNRAAESVGQATLVDRCDVLLVDADRFAAVRGSWSQGPDAALLPRPDAFVDLPEELVVMLMEAAQSLSPLQIDSVDTDDRLDHCAVQAVRRSLGVAALLAIPVSVGDEVVGWLLLSSIEPRRWHAREIHICQGVSHDLVASLVQLQAFEQQRESMRRMEELDRAKDAFISTVSHELRTPLTSIVGYLELVSEGSIGGLPEELTQSLRVIERNVDRLRGLVEDLLSLSDYDDQQVRPALRPVDLVAVVADCQQALAPLTADKHLELVVVGGGAPVRVAADRAQIERVLHNLLHNAVKFSLPGGTVTVRLTTGPEHVVVRITDEGIGIPREEQHRLFSRFFRSSLSDAEEIQGSGLGLALVRTVVEWHGGSVDVEPEQGHGTTVTVVLPRGSEAAVETRSPVR